MTARLVILSGPSCIGKTPLVKALQRLFPGPAAALRPLVLYNDRAPRPGEVDGEAYHFRPREVIEALRDRPGFVVMPVRRDLQALEIAQVQEALEAGLSPLFDGNAYIAEALLTAPQLREVPRLSCFLSPLSLEEVRELQARPDLDLETVVTEIMRQKLIRRTTRQKGQLSDGDRQDLEARCRAAYPELRYAPLFDWVLPNHDGEDSDNWELVGYPLGEARRCLQDFAALLQGHEPRWAEKWPGGVLDGK